MKPSILRPRTALLVFLVASVLCGIASAAAAVESDGPLFWPEDQRAFFQDGPGLLLIEAQRAELESMNEEGRRLFIDAFLGQDPIPETEVNELVQGIELRRRLALGDFATPGEIRAQLLFLNGRPAERQVVDCGVAFRPMEIWTYLEDPGDGLQPLEKKVVVYQPTQGEPWKLWIPFDTKRAVYTSEMTYWLEQWEELQGRVLRAKRFDLKICKEARDVDEATGIHGLREFQRKRPTQSDYERFLEPPTDLAVWARAAAATEVPPLPPRLPVDRLEILFPEKRGQRMITRALIVLSPDAQLGEEKAEGAQSETAETEETGEVPAQDQAEVKGDLRLVADGVVERNGKVFDDFRIRFRIPSPAKGIPVALAFERSLRTDRAFLLRMEVTDEVSGATTRLSRAFMVPSVATPVDEPPVPEDVVVALGEELAEMRIEGADSLILVPPETDVVLGLWRAEALVTGIRIERVVFLVDGKPQLSRTSPPFTAEVRLAEFPTEQLVRAEGFDSEGMLVAADEVLLNQPRGALRVRIVEPRRGERITGRVKAGAEITVPEERRVEKVEFRLNDELVTTLEKPPWEAMVEVPVSGEISYLAVAAFLDDDSRGEDVRFLNAPRYLENVDVNLVELYTAVTDRSGRLTIGLSQNEFEVFEDGRLQTLSKFELVDDLPLTVGITIDTSGSMVSSLAEAKLAAVDFLDNVIDSSDRTFAVSFSSKALLLMPPTDDVEGVAKVIEGLQAVGWTALHDAVVTSLYYFRGIKGQRALVVLSDGDDTASSIPFRNALEYARRSGVAIYTVGLNVGRFDVGIRNKLNDLAKETGGRSFFIKKAEDLAGVYEEIEAELRSRYLLAYNSDGTGKEGEFREIEVEVKRRGLKARTISGYYP